MVSKKYTAKDIQVLTDREHVRLRTQVYLGNTSETEYSVPLFLNDGFVIKELSFVPAVYKAVGEILDNSIDEFAQIKGRKVLTMDSRPIQGRYKITDNGRGIPIGKHETGKYTPEVALGSLRSGRNFEDEITAGVIGQNGVGSACTNYCSSHFAVEVLRDNKRYAQLFSNGAEIVSKPSIRKKVGRKTGTSIKFELDHTVFKTVSIPEELMENRAIEIALTNPGVTVDYNGTKYRYRNGFEDVIKKISSDYYRFEKNGAEFFVIFDLHEGVDEKIFSWVNSSLLFDGGICNTQFLNAFYDRVTTQLEKEAKKMKCVVTKNDIRQNLLVIGNLRLSNPEYDAQSKTRLTGPQRRKEMGELLDSDWSLFARRNKEWLTTVLERSVVRHHASANQKAIKDHTKNLNRKVAGLIDATSKDRSVCQLLITEGDSASRMITQARDPVTTASLPLSGKVNNVYGSTVAQLLNMGKMTDLLAVIGLIPGQKAMRYDLRYNRIVIATDADVDGGDIFTLLINLLFQFWPELFDPDYEPIVYRLLAPNVCLVKGKKRVHFVTRADYEKVKKKYASGWTVNYYKGLGSMVNADWEMILSGETNTMIPITNDGGFKDTLKLLFEGGSIAADNRKEWLQNE